MQPRRNTDQSDEHRAASWRPQGLTRASYRLKKGLNMPSKGSLRCPLWVTCGRRLGKNFLT
jgi:hypothetical protein